MKRVLLITFLLLVCAAGRAQEITDSGGGSGFMDVVIDGGFLGIVLWLSLAALSLVGTHLIVDSFIKIRAKRIIPDSFVSGVRDALQSNNCAVALELCAKEPGALANILTAGFSHAGDGAEAMQDAVGTAADLESEKMLQRINYLNVVGNLAPMLGLLGTVQGMIMAFATLGTEAGAAKNAMLATNISQALYTTAAGLVIAVPALGFFSFFRNRATKIILTMEALTMEMMRKMKG